MRNVARRAFSFVLALMVVLSSALYFPPKVEAAGVITAAGLSTLLSALSSYGYSFAMNSMDKEGLTSAFQQLFNDFSSSDDSGLRSAANIISAITDIGRSINSGSPAYIGGNLYITKSVAAAVATFGAWLSSRSTDSSVVYEGVPSYSYTFTDGVSIPVLYTDTTFNFDKTQYRANDPAVAPLVAGLSDVLVGSYTHYTSSGCGLSASFSGDRYTMSNRVSNSRWSSYYSGFPGDNAFWANLFVDGNSNVFILSSDYFDGDVLYYVRVHSFGWDTWSYCSVDDVFGAVDVNTPSITFSGSPALDVPSLSDDSVISIPVSVPVGVDVPDAIIDSYVQDDVAVGPAVVTDTAAVEDIESVVEATSDVGSLGLPALGQALSTRFPFSIPWDIGRAFNLLVYPAEVPYFEVDFLAPLDGQVHWQGSTAVEIDFSDYEILGRLSRWTITIGFCIVLAVATRKFTGGGG